MKKTLTIFIILFLLSCQGQNKEKEKKIEVENKTSNINVRDKKNKTLIPLSKLSCKTESYDSPNYNIKCESFSISNTIIEGSDKNRYELITFDFKDIDKAIIRKINNEDIETSPPLLYFSNSSKIHLIFFPLNSENHFGWKIYLYKDKILYPVGQRVLYWKPEYEESSVNYADILTIYELKDNIIIEIPNKYVIKNDDDYKNYPNYSDGKFYEKGDKLVYEFSINKIEYYKNYTNGLYEGDYNKMINNKIIDIIK
ncbi:hypothetical protein NG800_009365 [Epilithonimonas ginsengisoli]|uniref:Lipoprotein n=1 Tax=Epilithonimonas ginsengisoli TaxID=1245592 RepID=A0ABU4JHW5_9FLAO|nr:MULTISPECIES: hypothetical protein [Chryseobacterium group]MBV6880543.1 hypothetical protein [Epilithonimonas sp. FP105]MDW8549121.1 hypothetical protein [Epilithonimonas ginsengisoli]OAH72861.1 hypothetical protein AXA65_09245 [Chryseobacterium sp. FP211-J200]